MQTHVFHQASEKGWVEGMMANSEVVTSSCELGRNGKRGKLCSGEALQGGTYTEEGEEGRSTAHPQCSQDLLHGNASVCVGLQNKHGNHNIAGWFCQFWVVGRAHRFWIEIFVLFSAQFILKWVRFLGIFFLLCCPPGTFPFSELNVQWLTLTELINWIVNICVRAAASLNSHSFYALPEDLGCVGLDRRGVWMLLATLS